MMNASTAASEAAKGATAPPWLCPRQVIRACVIDIWPARRELEQLWHDDSVTRRPGSSTEYQVPSTTNLRTAKIPGHSSTSPRIQGLYSRPLVSFFQLGSFRPDLNPPTRQHDVTRARDW